MGWRWHDGYHVAGWMDGWVMDGCSYPDHGLILAPPIGCLESHLIIFGPSRYVDRPYLKWTKGWAWKDR